ncbi:uncharacterized protein [Haliaeetus albicilla]|uniref:uncharacterized protein n=1 Tax=Haliaeetus albicilla TaxID=8969 RepID=UPI0037E97ADC
MDCDQASLAAYILELNLTQPAHACTPAERVRKPARARTPAEQIARSGALSEALALVSCLGSCSLQQSVPDPRAVEGFSPALPAPGSRGTQELRSQQQSVTPAAAAPVRGRGSMSLVPPSSPQHMESVATELDDHCPTCLGSWEEASFVMPCLHRFCYPCVLRWAESKPECPLCKRRILSILHSVQADDDYMEHIITPPSGAVRQAGGAPRRAAAHNLHLPGAPQRWAAEGVPRCPVGIFQPPNWLNNLQDNPALLQILQPCVHRQREEIFGSRVLEAAMEEDTVTTILTSQRMDTELLGWVLGVSCQKRKETLMQHHRHVAAQRCSREAQRLLGWQDAPAAGGQDGHPMGAHGPTATQGGSLVTGPASSSRSSTDELPGTSSAAVGGGPSSHPSAPVAIPVEQEVPQEEPGEAVPEPSTSSRGSERSPGRPQRAPKRRTDSSEASPANKRPAPRR